NICAIKSGMWNYVRSDIDSVVTAAHLKGKTVKIILETGLLTDAEIQQLCGICLEVKPDFVKTSTGFNGEGATVHAVERLKALLHNQIKIKAPAAFARKKMLCAYWKQARLGLEAPPV